MSDGFLYRLADILEANYELLAVAHAVFAVVIVGTIAAAIVAEIAHMISNGKR